MQALFDWIFSTDPFVPHGMCLLWRPDLVWTHVGADAVTAVAYFTIPAFLVKLVRGRDDLSFSWAVYAFGAFILLCGLTHVVGIVSLWIPLYGLEAVIKVATALASVLTAVLVWPLLPKLLAIPSRTELETMNQRLEQGISARTDELRQANARLTVLVHEVLHRTKNNLAIVLSMLRMAMRELGPTASRGPFSRVISHVEAMATVQQELYGGEAVAEMDGRRLLDRLVATMRRVDPVIDVARIELDAQPVPIDPDQAVPLALVAHEALIGVTRRAEGGPVEMPIAVTLAVADDLAILELSRPTDAGDAASAQPTAAAPRLVEALARQLGGTSRFDIEGGRMRFVLRFPVKRARTADRMATGPVAGWTGQATA